MGARGKSRLTWMVSGTVSTVVTGLGGLALTACSPQPLDVVNGCEVTMSVYSGTNDARAGTTSRVDTVAPGATAATYVPDDGQAVIYIRVDGSPGWSGPLPIDSVTGEDGTVAYVVQGDACLGSVGGVQASDAP